MRVHMESTRPGSHQLAGLGRCAQFFTLSAAQARPGSRAVCSPGQPLWPEKHSCQVTVLFISQGIKEPASFL